MILWYCDTARYCDTVIYCATVRFTLYITLNINWCISCYKSVIVLKMEFAKILILSETHWRPSCLIGDCNMPDWRPTCQIRDRHASSTTDMPNWSPSCLIGEPLRLTSKETHCTCLIFDGSQIKRFRIWWGILISDKASRSLMRHVEVSEEAYQSSIRMSVSDGSPIMHVGLRWVSDRSSMVIIFSWTPWNVELFSVTYVW